MESRTCMHLGSGSTYTGEGSPLTGVQNCRVYTYQLAFGVEKDASRIPRVDGCISLDDALDLGAVCIRLNLSLQPAHQPLHSNSTHLLHSKIGSSIACAPTLACMHASHGLDDRVHYRTVPEHTVGAHSQQDCVATVSTQGRQCSRCIQGGLRTHETRTEVRVWSSPNGFPIA
jgi:hypothetical protein